MSEANILNPSATSLLNFDYGYSDGLPEMLLSSQPAMGPPYSRRVLGLGRIYELVWQRREKAIMHQLRQWAEQYDQGFFSLADWERARYFSGRFEGALRISPVGNDAWEIRARFQEFSGLALFAYPSDWARDAKFLEERNDFAEDLVKLTGTWTLFVSANGHGGQYYFNSGTITTNSAEWLYFGYGFRYWAPKAPDFGIGELSATRIRDGTIVQAATNIDLYAAAAQASAVQFTKSDLALDWYRVKIRATNTKNAAATDFKVIADAIEVMR